LRLRQGWRQCTTGHHLAKGSGRLADISSQLIGDGHYPAALGCRVIERTFGHWFMQHGFQADGLRGQLNVITSSDVGGLVAAAVLVFDGRMF
jgi:hypothetical protein